MKILGFNSPTSLIKCNVNWPKSSVYNLSIASFFLSGLTPVNGSQGLPPITISGFLPMYLIMS